VDTRNNIVSHIILLEDFAFTGHTFSPNAGTLILKSIHSALLNLWDPPHLLLEIVWTK
jgi:hypothetical protein